MPFLMAWPGVFAATPFAIWFFLGIEGVANVAEEAIQSAANHFVWVWLRHSHTWLSYVYLLLSVQLAWRDGKLLFIKPLTMILPIRHYRWH